jgi:hypothetical protein
MSGSEDDMDAESAADDSDDENGANSEDAQEQSSGEGVEGSAASEGAQRTAAKALKHCQSRRRKGGNQAKKKKAKRNHLTVAQKMRLIQANRDTGKGGQALWKHVSGERIFEGRKKLSNKAIASALHHKAEAIIAMSDVKGETLH